MATVMPDGFPRRRDDIVMQRRLRNVLLQDGEGNPILAINDTAAALWELCDGDTSVDEMVVAICELSLLARDVVAEDVARALTGFWHAGVLRWQQPSREA